MAKQVTVNEIENLIKEKLKSSGADLSNDIVSRIKESILKKYSDEKSQNEASEANTGEPVDIDISSEPSPTEQDVPTPGSVQQDTVVDSKEQELQRKEEELYVKEQELQRKEEELKYKPQLPNPLKNVGKEEFFVFDENQISFGGEGLSNAQFYLKNNPEVKSSMHGEWINKGMTKADLFIVEFKKIGEMEFNAFDGTTKLERYTESEQSQTSTPVGFPIEKIVVPNSTANTGDSDVFDEIIKDKIEKYFSNKFK